MSPDARAPRRRGDADASSRRTPESDARLVGLVRELGTMLAELGLSEVEVRDGGLRLRLQRTAKVEGGGGAPALLSSPPLAAATDVTSPALVTVEAPMVGTFYRASSPAAEPYVREGDLVKHGEILCIIEAMKLMNEIESKVSGRIVKILVENGQPVEYGHPLLLIDPR